MLPQLESLGKVAATLREVRGERFVFAGASILPLFLDAAFAGALRRTKDTDVVVPVLHYAEWSRLRDALVAVGFRERADVRMPRQILFWLGDIQVDFIPARMSEFGMKDRWLSLGYDLAEADELENGETFLRLPVSAWLAAKIAAFEERGRRDILMSKDLEDIAMLLIGRRTLAADVNGASGEIRAHIVEAFRSWRNQSAVLDALDGSVTAASERQVLEMRFGEIAAS